MNYHKHKTYGINWRNPNRKYTHQAIKGVEYCPICNELIEIKQIVKTLHITSSQTRSV